MPEEKKFTFKQCYQLLQISPKSFLGWLNKEGIDPEQQRDKFDPRKKYLYKSQLEMLAEKHGRTLPQLDDYGQDVEATPTIETLAEQLDLLHTEITRRLDQVEQITLQQLSPILKEIVANQRKILANSVDAPAWQQIAQRFDQLELSVREQVPPQAAALHQDAMSKQDVPETKPGESAPSEGKTTRPAKKNAAPSKSKATSKKKTARGKKLPRHLVALRDFANQHGIVTERASAAGKTGKIEIVRGKWLVNSRWAYEALTERGQQDFYQLFHKREGFLLCPQCPHEASGSDAHHEAALNPSSA